MSRFHRSAIRVVSLAAVVVLAALLLFGIGALSSRVQAAEGSRQVSLFQDYPPNDDPPTSDPGYPVDPTEPPPDEPYPGSPTDTAPVPVEDTPTQPAEDTPIPANTPLPTEDITAPQTQPAAASPTASAASTQQALPTGTQTPDGRPTELLTRPAVTLTPPPEQSGGIDWGLFWIGFSIPVLTASGVVLYLLDRQPTLLQRRGRKP